MKEKNVPVKRLHLRNLPLRQLLRRGKESLYHPARYQHRSKKREQELGQPIFERSSSRILLTDAGRAYIDAVEKLHRIEEDLKVYCNDLSNLKTGALRIGASSFFLSSIVLPVVAEYSRRYPGISLDVQEAPSLELQKRLANEALDILVDPVDQQCDTFNSVILFEDHFLLAVPDAPNFFASMGIKKTFFLRHSPPTRSAAVFI